MKIFKEHSSISAYTKKLRSEGAEVGFVPTMGALHPGHLSLVKQSLSENDATVVSIFVNPTQFNDSADFDKYPRQIQSDLDLLSTVSENLIVFVPESKEEVYNETYTSIKIELGLLEEVFEAPNRPGHFEGVLNVVYQLFRIINPNRAYFGAKDYQQLAVIRKMVKDLNLSIEISGCPIIREESGLAMSSRNMRLSAQGKETAASIYQALASVRSNMLAYSVSTCLHEATNHIQRQGIEIEYLSVADAETLSPISEWHDANKHVVLFAGYCEQIRLIDNVQLN